MKKIISKLMLLAMTAITFTACEDVPEPYDMPGSATNPIGDELTEGLYMTESFNSDFGKFTNVSVTGIPWVIDHNTAKATGYNNSVNTVSEAYLVSAPIDLTASTSAFLTFDYILAYANNEGENKVLITDSYDETNIAASNWEDITGKLQAAGRTADGKVDWTTFSTYSANIPAKYIGKNNVRVAFFYTGTASGSRTWEVKNVAVKEGQAPEVEDNTPTVETKGTLESPYSVTDAKTVGTGTGVYVKGYIVGYIDGKSITEGAVFAGNNATVETNVIIATSADETSIDNCIPIQLPTESNAPGIRSGVNLKSNPANYKKEVIFKGDLDTYFGTVGVKNTSWAKIDDKEIGNDTPGETPTPTPTTAEPKGDGTQANPYNAIAAYNAAAALAKGAKSDNDVYVKGIISTVKYTYDTQHGTATFTISEDGQAANEFIIYGCLYFNNQKYTAGENIKKGDEVVVCGKLTNYNGTTPEMASGANWLVSLNGKTEATGGEKPTPTPVVTGEGSHDQPFSVATVISKGTASTTSNVYVKGYIVGWIDGQVLSSGAKFNAEATVKSNLLLADTANETDISKCVPVQLPNNAVRTSLNLQDNPSFYGKQVLLYGNLEKYFGTAGVKGVTYAECEGQTIGTAPAAARRR